MAIFQDPSLAKGDDTLLFFLKEKRSVSSPLTNEDAFRTTRSSLDEQIVYLQQTYNRASRGKGDSKFVLIVDHTCLHRKLRLL